MPWCFRLLNSEIGNDRRAHFLIVHQVFLSFRLLNSEIGNDPSRTV